MLLTACPGSTHLASQKPQGSDYHSVHAQYTAHRVWEGGREGGEGRGRGGREGVREGGKEGEREGGGKGMGRNKEREGREGKEGG